MKRKIIPYLLLILAVQIVFPLPSSANANDSHTYTVISFDGMRHDFTKNYMDEGLMPNFKKVKENGLFAQDIRTVYPSLTAASHAAISSGAKPDKTGMISNNLHMPDMKLTDSQSAFFSPLDVTPIWAEARKQGKTTATILFPGSNPKEGNEATYAIYYGNTWSESSLDELEFKRAVEWHQLPKSYSTVKEASLNLDLKKAPNQKLYILATDSTDNGVEDYDTFYFYQDRNRNHSEVVHKNEWGYLSFSVNKHYQAGFSFKLKETDPSLSSVKLYRTAITSGVFHGPDGFKEEINKKFGVLPIQDDDDALEKKWITRSEYEDISERFAKWTTDVSLYIKERYKPDLLMFYYPQIDHEEHKYLLVDPRQPGYSKEKSRQYMNYIKWAYELADRSLGETLKTMNDKDRLFLVSDHGMEPVHSMISPNKELEKAGLLRTDKEGKIDTSESKAYAVASGAIAHIYINLEGRQRNGIVSKKEYQKIQKEIINTFNELKVKKKDIPKTKKIRSLYNNWQQKDTTFSESISVFGKMLRVLTGSKEKPFEAVIAAESEENNFLDHDQAGDVLLIAKQGYYMTQDEESTVKKAIELGNHGGDPERIELRPILFVTGNNYPKAEISEEISTLDIAPTLYKLMGLTTPDFIDGKVIKKIIEADNHHLPSSK